MSLFQKIMNKYFKWKYAVFYGMAGQFYILRYYELPSGLKYLKGRVFNNTMHDDGSMGLPPYYNGDPVRWENL